MDQLSMYATPTPATSAAPTAPAPVSFERYLITDVTGRQVEVHGPGNTWNIAPVAHQPVAPAAAGPQQAQAIVVQAGEPLFPRWAVKLALGIALGGLAIGGAAIGLELLAVALDHIAHAIAELVKALVMVVALVVGLAVAIAVLGTFNRSTRGGEAAGNVYIDNSVTTNVTNVTNHVKKLKVRAKFLIK